MSMKERLRRYILFLTGLFFLAGGVVLTLKSALGTTPLATIPYAVHRVSGLSFGLCTFFMSPLFLTCQILLMRREFKKEQWLQLPIGFLLGVFQNIWLFLLQGHLEPSGYLPRLLLMLLACLVLGFGVALEVTANVVIDSAAALTKNISDKFHFDFGRTKVCFDSSLVVIGAIIAWVGLHTIVGIREGTLVLAVLAGLFAGFFKKRFVFMNRFLADQAVAEKTSA